MSGKREIMDLAQNDPTMCHCRVWCRETGIAGGSGGYEKGCPQLNIKYRPSKSFTEEEKKMWMSGTEDDRPPLCLFHARNLIKHGGLPFGLITEERPKTFGECGTPHGFKNRVGQEIKWKCDPPDYTKTHKEHPYRLRDDTSSKDLMRNKYEQQLKKAETSEKYQRERRKIAETRRAYAERELVDFIKVSYGMPHYMSMKFDRENRYWLPMNPNDSQVQEYFAKWYENLTLSVKGKSYQRRKLGRDKPEFSNRNLNEKVFDKIKKPEDLVWEDKDELNDRLRAEYKNYDEKVALTCDCRDILFDVVNALPCLV